MVSVLGLSAVGQWFEPCVCETKDYKNGICCFFAKHTALRSNSKDWLAQNQNNVSKTEWSDMSTSQTVVSVSYLYKNPTHYKVEIMISSTYNLFLPW